ncbi:MAG TPA: site-2 protease family protein [Gemmatimonadaceae bacterium]|jgi:Zn-dependent protease|nr:site-2 protease family protein [Gemmatimonadaceae bacterium]
MIDLADALTYFVVFLFSTTLHEAAHAWVALKGGDATAYHGGQVSLDPRPHIKRHPFGMVVLPLLSAVMTGWPLGFASAPYDPDWARRYPRRAAIMALAGPVSNLLLATIAAVALRVGESRGVFFAPDHIQFGRIAGTELGGGWEIAAHYLGIVFSMNLLLFFFNMLPFVPLDGSSVITLFMSENTTRRYQEFLWSTPMLTWVGMMIAWQLADVVFNPVFVAAVSLIYPNVRYG